MFSYLNYIEDRIAPFSYETQIYDAAVEDLLRTQPALEGCEETAEEQFALLKLKFIEIFSSGAMRDDDAFKSYASYIANKDHQMTRQMALQSVQDMTLPDFDTGLFMRLTKLGIEDHDDRSTYDDFSDFESKYIGKKGRAPKPFKTLWGSFTKVRQCLLQTKGILRYEEIKSAARDPISNQCDPPAPRKLKWKNKNKNKNPKKNKPKNPKRNKNKVFKG